jgi:hypothetical protein
VVKFEIERVFLLFDFIYCVLTSSILDFFAPQNNLMRGNKITVLHSEDVDFLADLEKEPEGSGTISGHSLLSGRKRNSNVSDDDEDGTPPPQPQERFLFPPSDSDEDDDAEARPKPRSCPPAKKEKCVHIDSEDEEDSCDSRKKGKRQVKKIKEDREGAIKSVKVQKDGPRKDAACKHNNDAQKPNARKGGSTDDKKNSKKDRAAPKLPKLPGHEAFRLGDSVEWIPSPKHRAPGFDILRGQVLRHSTSKIHENLLSLERKTRHGVCCV